MCRTVIMPRHRHPWLTPRLLDMRRDMDIRGSQAITIGAADAIHGAGDIGRGRRTEEPTGLRRDITDIGIMAATGTVNNQRRQKVS